MNLNQNNHKEHDHKVGSYFEKAAVTFDTFYDYKRSVLMRWLDRKFRSDVFERYRLSFETLKPLNGKTVFDIGCGSGPYVVESARRGAKRVVGLDMAKAMLEMGRQRADAAGVADKCEFVLGTFPTYRPDEKFDYSITMGVMDYISEPLAFLTALAKIIRVRSVLSFPSYHWYRTPIREFRYWLKRCPVYFYEADKIKEIAQAAGFSEVKIHKIPGAGQDYFVTLIK